MRPLHSIALVVLMLLGAGACAPAVYDDSPGCLPEESYCIDDFTISTCERGRFVGYDCEEVCFDAGFPRAVGCGYDPGYGYDACLCN